MILLTNLLIPSPHLKRRLNLQRILGPPRGQLLLHLNLLSFFCLFEGGVHYLVAAGELVVEATEGGLTGEGTIICRHDWGGGGGGEDY